MSAKVSISQHFKRLLDFSGREDRASFWPYAAVAFGIVMVVNMIAFAPIIIDATSNTERATLVSSTWIAVYLAAMFGTSFVLYSAAIVRRLRDAGRSIIWALLPLPFIIYSSIQMPRVMGSAGNADQDTILFTSVFASSLFYNISLLILIVMLTLASKPDRYAEF
ncbi:MAG: DUF805 domain-containing protein [Sphingomonadaceae bacterium]|nr:DUF805 domain-containing protein [Sphingomonadaceae bacterium]